MATNRRRQSQTGQEIIEFALISILLVPMFLGMFVVGMNLIRSIQANQVVRDIDDMFIHGADFSTLGMQQEAQRLAQGLNLQISAFSGDTGGHEQANTGNSGNSLITVTEIMWVGDSTSQNCQLVGASNCTNQNSFVYVQQLQFGNGTLANSGTVSVGTPSGATINSSGVVANNVTDTHAQLPSAAQSAMQAVWAASAGTGQQPLADGQVAYITEGYFQSPDLTISSLSGSGVYARYFF